MITKALATFRGRTLGIGLDRGEWFAFIGSPTLSLPGRHPTLEAAMRELGDEVDRFDRLAGDVELQWRYPTQRRWRRQHDA